MRLVKLTIALLLLVAVCASLAGAPQTRTGASAVLFEGARLIVGDGKAPIENSAFLVESDKFARVGKKGEIRLPAGAAGADDHTPFHRP